MQQHDISMQTALSTQPVPEFWCSVAYFELDTQVSGARDFAARQFSLADEDELNG